MRTRPDAFTAAREHGERRVRRSAAPRVDVAREQLGEQIGQVLCAFGANSAVLGAAGLRERARRLHAALPHVPEDLSGQRALRLFIPADL